MDHHCPWVGNCVGHKNHKVFWNFLLHSTLGCFIVTSTIGYQAYGAGGPDLLPELMYRYLMSDLHYFIIFIASTFLTFCLSGLLAFHTYVIINNYSTLEAEQLRKGNAFMNKKKKILSKEERNKPSKSL